MTYFSLYYLKYSYISYIMNYLAIPQTFTEHYLWPKHYFICYDGSEQKW